MFIELAKSIPGIDGKSIVRWRVVSAEDRKLAPSTCLLVRVQMYGEGETDANPYGNVRTLCIRDGAALSSCLRVNPDGQTPEQHLEIYDNVIGGTPYTTLLAAYAGDEGEGAKRKDPTGYESRRLQRLQAALVASGAMSPEFAGT